MALMIRNNNSIQGIDFGDECMTKILLFADDTTFFLKDINSLSKTLEVLKQFKQFSGLQINREKSEIGWLGPNITNSLLDTSHHNLKWIDFHESGIKILGIYFSHNRNYHITNNYERIFQNFKTTLTIWKSRLLTPIGRIQVVKALGLSKLLYVCTKLGANENFFKRVKDEAVNFIWNGRKPKIL